MQQNYMKTIVITIVPKGVPRFHLLTKLVSHPIFADISENFADEA